MPQLRRIGLLVILALSISAGVSRAVAAEETTNTASNILTGASLATCDTNPCKPGLIPESHRTRDSRGTQPPCELGPISSTVNEVSVGSIDDGVQSSCRAYGFYRPENLSGSPATMLVAPGTNGACGTVDPPQTYHSNHWHRVANRDRLLIVYLAKAFNGSSCTTGSQPVGWRDANFEVPDPGAGAASDEPYVAAVVRDVESRLHADPQRIFSTG